MSTAIRGVDSGGTQTLAGPITATPHAAHAGYTCWKIGDKTGNNGKDAFGDIAMAWSRAGRC